MNKEIQNQDWWRSTAMFKNVKRTFVSKGWGYEDWLVNKEEYCGKLLFIKKGKKFSWHYHKLKDETFYVHSGKVQIIYGFDDNIRSPRIDRTILEPGDTFYVPVGMRHQAKGLLNTHMFEFSTTHFDEDSYRILKGD